MNPFSRVISASLSPNTEPDDIARAVRTLSTPWRWKTGSALSFVTQWFQKTYKTPSAYVFNSGRSAFLAILTAFGIGKGDEVIVQAFTCVAVPNSVLWAGATPVYVDIDQSYNIDPVALANKITRKTKAIVVQHTFGIPANMDAIATIAQKHNVLLIEDCAHALGARYKGAPLGSLGDAAFFSFGRDKSLSSVWGGAAIINAKRKTQNENLKKYHESLPMPGMFWIFQQLLHPIAFSIILPLYNLGIGKLFIVVLQRLRLLSIPVYREEKYGKKPPGFPARYPNALALLLMTQLGKLDRYTSQRQNRVQQYYEFLKNKKQITLPKIRSGTSCVRYPILVDDPVRIREAGKKRGILLGNWYHNVIDPKGVDFGAVGFIEGSCPNAEYVALHCINLPTRVSSSQADTLREFFRTI